MIAGAMIDVDKLVAGADLGDSRRNDRVLQIVSGIIQGHSSATHGTGGAGHEGAWAHAMGAYRLFDNDEVSLPALYGMVGAGIAELVPAGWRCYVMHDFSWVDYAKQSAKADRIRISNGRSIGYDLYSALVVNDRGQPLAPVIQELRTSHGCLSSESDVPLPYDGHLEQTERGVAAARRRLPGRELVHVADREFDDVGTQRAIAAAGDKYVIRAQHLSRWVRTTTGAKRKLGELTERVVLQLAGTTTHDGKEYDLYQGETRVEFVNPSRRGITASKNRGTKPPKPVPGVALSVRVVVAELRERGTPDPKAKPLRWVLLTNLDDALSVVVQAYLWRWRVERLFFLLKVGFRLEDWRQETGQRIARRLALSNLAAMVVYQLQSAREQPEVDATLRAVAAMGGWIDRKGQPMGPIVLMRGMQTLIAGLAAVARFGIDRLQSMAEELGFGFAIQANTRAANRRRSATSRRTGNA